MGEKGEEKNVQKPHLRKQPNEQPFRMSMETAVREQLMKNKKGSDLRVHPEAAPVPRCGALIPRQVVQVVQGVRHVVVA